MSEQKENKSQRSLKNISYLFCISVFPCCQLFTSVPQMLTGRVGGRVGLWQ